jgi:hypothetical protein
MHIAANATIYRFKVTERRVVPALLKALVVMAIRETDLIFGPACRKLETDVRLSTEKSVCVIEGGNPSGEHLARLLAAFLIKQVGEDGFVVQRLCKKNERKG